MSKYEPLQKFLNTEATITLNYEQIENVLNDKLPEAAYSNRAWWANTSGSHVQAKAWLEAYWKVVEIELGKSVTFKRYTSDDGICE